MSSITLCFINTRLFNNNNIRGLLDETLYTYKYIFCVSDYVYVETNQNSPFLIRRIEELNKNQSGNVEAKVMCFYRRRDLPNPLVQLADKHQRKSINITTHYFNFFFHVCAFN